MHTVEHAVGGGQPVERADASILYDPARNALLHELDEVGDVGTGLQADEVIGRERLLVAGEIERMREAS